MATRASSPVFVGRSDEISRLLAAFHRVLDGREAAVVLAGAAGIGKTRLVAEFRRRVEGDGARVLVGRCAPVGDAIPYAPIIEALRAPERRLGRQAILERLTVPGESAIGGGPVGPFERNAADRAALFARLLDLLDERLEAGPIVFVIEDIQWAGNVTLELLAFLTRNAPARLLPLMTHRTAGGEDAAAATSLIGEIDVQPGGDVIRLGPLADADIERLLEAVLEAPPSATVLQHVVALSGGNPFLAEELCATITRGAEDTLPSRLRDVLGLRFTRLDAEARRVMETAAAAGERVPLGVLQRATRGQATVFAASLERLESGGIMSVDQGRQRTVRFRHELLRQAAYDRMDGAVRVSAHKRIADSLEQSGDAATAAEIAFQWRLAQQPAREVPHALRAGDQAMGLFAFDEAAAWYRRAAEIAATAPEALPAEIDLATALLRVAEAEASRGDEAAADRFFAQAITAIDRSTSFARWYLAGVRRVTWLWSGGDERASEALATELRSVAIPDELSQPAAVLAARSRILMWSLDDRDFDEPERLARLATDRSLREGDVQSEAIARLCMGNVLFNTGRVEAGVDEFRQSASAALRARAYRELRSATSMLMAALGESEHWEEAMAAGDAVLAEVDALGVRPSVRHSMFGNWVESALWLGRWDEAVAWIDAAIGAAIPDQEAAHLLRSRALIHVARGDFPDALHDVATAERLGPSMLQSQQVGGLSAVRAESAYWHGQYGAAAEATRVGIERSEATKAEDIYHDLVLLGLRIEADRAVAELRDRGDRASRPVRDRMATLLGNLRRRRAARDPRLTLYRGQIDVAWGQARAEAGRVRGRTDPGRWAVAAEGWARLRRPYAEAYARLRLGEALLEAGDPGAAAAAREALGQALRLTERLGARPLRESVDVVLSRAGIDPASLPAVIGDLDRLGLTVRERDVLRRLTAGRSNKEIGADLGISEKTAEIHVSSVLRKLGVTNRVEAATRAVSLGIRGNWLPVLVTLTTTLASVSPEAV